MYMNFYPKKKKTKSDTKVTQECCQIIFVLLEFFSNLYLFLAHQLKFQISL